VSTALLTDKYELTMLSAALKDGSAGRRTTFEVFARRLPAGRRYGVVAGTGRLLEALTEFVFDDVTLAPLAAFLDQQTLDYLRDFRFTGDIDGYAEGELYFPGSPILSVTGSFGECVLIETLALSILNHDSAIASAAARMVTAADGRALIEMGSRRTHEIAAVASARAAYLAGFTGTSNLEAQRRYGVPALGTSAHAFTMLHTGSAEQTLHTGSAEQTLHTGSAEQTLHTGSADKQASSEWEKAAFRAQIDALGVGTTLLVDTYDVTTGVDNAIAVAGTGLGAVRIDSGDLGVLARQVRNQLDELGATKTAIVVSGDLDEYSIAALRAEPVDIYGVGTSVVTGSGAPTASMVYKLVEVDGVPVQKRSSQKESRGGRKAGLRLSRPTGTIVEEIVHPFSRPPVTDQPARVLTIPLARDGCAVRASDLGAARDLVAAGLHSLPWEGLALSNGEPAIPTTQLTGSGTGQIS
jgi:nicotinate phosphoribosyltransferase